MSAFTCSFTLPEIDYHIQTTIKNVSSLLIDLERIIQVHAPHGGEQHDSEHHVHRLVARAIFRSLKFEKLKFSSGNNNNNNNIENVIAEAGDESEREHKRRRLEGNSCDYYSTVAQFPHLISTAQPIPTSTTNEFQEVDPLENSTTSSGSGSNSSSSSDGHYDVIDHEENQVTHTNGSSSPHQWLQNYISRHVHLEPVENVRIPGITIMDHMLEHDSLAMTMLTKGFNRTDPNVGYDSFCPSQTEGRNGVDYSLLPRDIILSILEYVQRPLAEYSVAQCCNVMCFNQIIGRFRNDPSRRYYLLYRSIMIGFNCDTVQDYTISRVALRFVLSHTKHIELRICKGNLPRLIRSATRTFLPRLQRVTLNTDVHSLLTDRNEFLQSMVHIVDLWVDRPIDPETAISLFPNLHHLYLPNISMEHVNVIAGHSQLKSLCTGTDSIEVVRRLVTQCTSITDLTLYTCPGTDEPHTFQFTNVTHLKRLAICAR